MSGDICVNTLPCHKLNHLHYFVLHYIADKCYRHGQEFANRVRSKPFSQHYLGMSVEIRLNCTLFVAGPPSPKINRHDQVIVDRVRCQPFFSALSMNAW